MSKLKYRAIIEDGRNEKCTDRELEALFGIFEHIMQEHVSNGAPSATFDLAAMPEAKEAGVDVFSLTITHETVGGADQWNAVFEKDNGKKLKLYATLARN